MNRNKKQKHGWNHIALRRKDSYPSYSFFSFFLMTEAIKKQQRGRNGRKGGGREGEISGGKKSSPEKVTKLCAL